LLTISTPQVLEYLHHFELAGADDLVIGFREILFSVYNMTVDDFFLVVLAWMSIFECSAKFSCIQSNASRFGCVRLKLTSKVKHCVRRCVFDRVYGGLVLAVNADIFRFPGVACLAFSQSSGFTD